MNICHQIYAATCKNRGFGVFYQSPEISRMDEDAISAIKRNAVYKEPYLLDSKTEVEGYPINYEYYVVSDAGSVKNVLAFSKYTGATNHSPNRGGNFITHTIVFDDPLDNCYIPDLLNVIPFRKSLTIEEESEFKAPLETIEYRCNRESILSEITKCVFFLNTNSGYLNAFLEAIDSIISGWLDAKGKSITILAPTNQECIKIIFALYSLLPPYVINHFSFATYVASPTNVPFQICGVIPECGVSKLPSEYFKLIRISERQETYTPAYRFTRVIKGWITNQAIEKIANLEKLFHDFDITHLDQSIEILFKAEEFKDVISKKTLSELNEIIQCFSVSPQKHVSDLLDCASKYNPQLYLEYKVQETQKQIKQNDSVSSHLGIIEQNLRELCTTYNDRQVLAFYSEIEKSLYDKVLVCRLLLLDDYMDIRGIIRGNTYLCDYLLSIVDKKWLTLDIQVREDIVNEYQVFLSDKYHNVQSWRSYNEIINDIHSGKFMEKSSDYHNVLSSISESDRAALFEELIEITNNKCLLSDRCIENVIALVNGYMDVSFWKKIFDGSESVERDKYWLKYEGKWPLSFIKRNFVYYYAIEHEELNDIRDIVDTLSEYETRWVFEKMIENHNKNGHERLLSMGHLESTKMSKLLSWLYK